MTIDTNLIYRGDCYSILKRNFPEKCVDLIYMDPPFSFDPTYARLWYDRESLAMFEEIRKGGVKHYVAWMSRRLEQCHRVLKETGSIYLHCDWKFGHYLKVEMDNIFGRNNFQNDIIWHYGLGGSSPKRWSRKHDMLLFYTKGKNWYFSPLMVPATSQRMKGKLKKMDDVWDIPAINNMATERTGYPTQKPLDLLEMVIKASSKKEDIVLDPMCGCGTTVVVAHKLGRGWIGIDVSSQACETMKKRLQSLEGILEVSVIGLPLTIKDLKDLTPFEFQDYICDMVGAEKTQKIADKGIDGYHSGETPIQIKQQERVGRNRVDEFETALRRKKKQVGYMIAFSFTRGAYEEVARALEDGLEIALVNVAELIRKDYELNA